MTASDIRLNRYLLGQFGRQKLFTTIENYMKLTGKQNQEPFTKLDFILLVYVLFTSFNIDLGKLDDRLQAFKKIKNLARAFDQVFLGEVNATKIIFDLANGDVYFYLVDPAIYKNMIVWDYHVPGQASLQDYEVTSFASENLIMHLSKIYKEL